MSASAPPKYVYKIVPGSLPNPLPRELPLSELDRADGFVHLSTAEQVGFSSLRSLRTRASFEMCSVDQVLWGA